MDIPPIHIRTEKSRIMRHSDSIDLSNSCRVYYQTRLETLRRLKERWKEAGEGDAAAEKFLEVGSYDRRMNHRHSLASTTRSSLFRRSTSYSTSISYGDVAAENCRATSASAAYKKSKATLDMAIGILRKEMVMLMDQDMSLMKQLLTLNEEIEDLKWRKRHAWSRFSSFYSSNMLQSAASIERVDEHAAFRFLTSSSLSLQLENSLAHLSVYNEDDPTGTFNRAASHRKKASKVETALSASPPPSPPPSSSPLQAEAWTTTRAARANPEVEEEEEETYSLNVAPDLQISFDDISVSLECRNVAKSLSDSSCSLLTNSEEESHNFSTTTSKDSCGENPQEDWVSDSCNDLMLVSDFAPLDSEKCEPVLIADEHYERHGGECTVLSMKTADDPPNSVTLETGAVRTMPNTMKDAFKDISSCQVTTDAHLFVPCTNEKRAGQDTKCGSPSPPNLGPSAASLQAVGGDVRGKSPSEGDSESQDSGIHDCLIVTTL